MASGDANLAMLGGDLLGCIVSFLSPMDVHRLRVCARSVSENMLQMSRLELHLKDVSRGSRSKFNEGATQSLLRHVMRSQQLAHLDLQHVPGVTSESIQPVFETCARAARAAPRRADRARRADTPPACAR